jgi:hypothetical protein
MSDTVMITLGDPEKKALRQVGWPERDVLCDLVRKLRVALDSPPACGLTLERFNEDDVQLLFESACERGIPFADFVAAVADLLQATQEQPENTAGIPATPDQPQLPSGPLGDEEREEVRQRIETEIDFYNDLLEQFPLGYDGGLGDRAAGVARMRIESRDRLVALLADVEAAFAARKLAEHPSSGDQLREWLRSDEARQVVQGVEDPTGKFRPMLTVAYAKAILEALSAALTDKAPSGDQEGGGNG